MVTWFECWNGGTVRWDPASPPQFVFALPPEDPEMVRFFQLSGRICEVLTQSEWLLNLGGRFFDIPNLPDGEIQRLVQQIRSHLGYVPISVPYQLAHPLAGVVTIPLALWVNVASGRADVYSPATGLVRGQQLLAPQAPAGDRPPPTAADHVDPGAAPQTEGGQPLLRSLVEMSDESPGVYDFLSSGMGSADYGAWEADTYAADPFEEDSAGWPGGAYENPDSAWYTPDAYDDA
jgi:hypothetical protein